MIKLRLLHGHVVAFPADVVVNENPHGGVRTVELLEFDTFWTGVFHLLGGRDIKFQTTAIVSIEARSIDDESNEYWEVLWTRGNGPFSYHEEAECAMFLEEEVRRQLR